MDLALGTSTWDLAITDAGEVQTVTGIEAIRQHMIVRLRFFLGEWFLDERDGVPYWERILVASPDTTAISEALRTTVARTPGVIGISRWSFALDRRARTLSVDFEANTNEGTVTAADLAQVANGAFAGSFAFGFGG